MTKLYFLRHAQTKVDPHRPVTDWDLTSSGAEECGRLVDTGVFDDVNLIVTSDERKAVLTGEIVARRIGCSLVQSKAFRELDRGEGMKNSQAEYQESVKMALSAMKDSMSGWEPAARALARFKKGVNERAEKECSSSLIVSHGIVLTLYFCELLNASVTAYERWLRLPFCAWGLVEEGRVVHDIVP